MTQQDDDSPDHNELLDHAEVVEHRDGIAELRDSLMALHGALRLHESIVERLERQADNPDRCRCAVQVFATIDGEGTLCKSCHDDWLNRQPVTYHKPSYLMGG